ncbi:ATP-binding protein [Kitasatospora acidiphila]|uniref:ATP-binding protein n=1 Tax=Kitasatospora acidiphila TaxID=2567942 RepID=A0A540W542_9ACTN|nr:ATP-binding protein [Kitasatospora acidiphila]
MPRMTSRTGAPGLLARDVELSALAEAHREAAGGEPVTVLVGGDAGIGKTRLVTEFTAALPDLVLTGGCLALGADGLPYAPFTTVLRRLVREHGRDWPAEALPGAGRTRWRTGCRSWARRATAGPGCSARCSPCWRRPRRSAAWCWCWRTCTGPTRPAANCCSSCSATSARPASCCWSPTAPPTSTTATPPVSCSPRWPGCPGCAGWTRGRSGAPTSPRWRGIR